MTEDNKTPALQQDELPEKDVFSHKEPFQFPQPADQGSPLKPKDQQQDGKEGEKTSKEEGLNEQNSAGNAGAFEGFEDHSANDR